MYNLQFLIWYSLDTLHRNAVKIRTAETKWGADVSYKDCGTSSLSVRQYWPYCDLPALTNLQSMSFTLHQYWFLIKLLRSSDNSFMVFECNSKSPLSKHSHPQYQNSSPHSSRNGSIFKHLVTLLDPLCPALHTSSPDYFQKNKIFDLL